MQLGLFDDNVFGLFDRTPIIQPVIEEKEIKINTSSVADNLESELGRFCGTLEWHKWSVLFPNYLLTDGAKYLADEAKAYWLMDLVGSWQPEIRKAHKKNYMFQVWKITTDNCGASVVCEDGNGHVLAKQEIDSTDFPLKEFSMYAIYEEEGMIILLPGEY